MHFRCVFTLLLCCVLVGLNWAEPLMYFKFACHVFMHFHAYIHSIFYILLYYVVGAFLTLSLSLSLSLSLALVCSMAPKRKSTPSRNPLRSKASSSFPSDPTPSHVWIRDEKAKLDFSEKRGIHLEHQVVLSYFYNIDLPTVIYSRG